MDWFPGKAMNKVLSQNQSKKTENSGILLLLPIFSFNNFTVSCNNCRTSILRQKCIFKVGRNLHSEFNKHQNIWQNSWIKRCMLRSDRHAALKPKEIVAVILQLNLCRWHLHAVNGASYRCKGLLVQIWDLNCEECISQKVSWAVRLQLCTALLHCNDHI